MGRKPKWSIPVSEGCQDKLHLCSTCTEKKRNMYREGKSKKVKEMIARYLQRHPKAQPKVIAEIIDYPVEVVEIYLKEGLNEK